MERLTRRRSLGLAAAVAATGWNPARAETVDGIGPNRGVTEHPFRGKQVCDNVSVPLSDMGLRLSTPDDFGSASCQLTEDSHEGPYFICTTAPGRNIKLGQSGQPLVVAFRLTDGDCQPISGGVVDIWACNATGHYSGYSYSPDDRPPMVRAILFGHIEPDLSGRFCRGALRTDDDGIAEFETIYPGFYYGQPIHIHFKVHVAGRNFVTSQAHLPEAWNNRIMKQPPYNSPRPIERTRHQPGFPEMRIVERDDQLVALLDLAVPN